MSSMWHFQRPWQAFRIVMRRLRTASAGVLLVFALGLLEPFLCILHCTVWLPLVYQPHHGHTMALGDAMAGMEHDMAMPGAGAKDEAHCVHTPNQQSASAAQPFHEAALTPILLLALLLIDIGAPPLARALRATRYLPPPLRPPIHRTPA